MIIGEAAVYGVNLISTKNLRSISHEKVNDWARRVHVMPPGEDLLNTPDRTVLGLAKGDPDQAVCWGASYNVARRLDEGVRWKEQLKHCSGSLSEAGMRYLGLLMRWYGEGGPDAEGLLVDELRQSGPLFRAMMDDEKSRRAGIAKAVDERLSGFGRKRAPRGGMPSP